MTSQISREDIHDQLYILAGPYKASMIPRVMLAIDRYAAEVAKRMQAPFTEPPPAGHYLKPGETDELEDLRCCPECGKVRSLSTQFVKDPKAPNGRRMHCVICRPRQWQGKTAEYLCRACKKRKELHSFPPAKQVNTRLMVSCLSCASNGK